MAIFNRAGAELVERYSLPEMVERNCSGIVAYYRSKEKVSLGFAFSGTKNILV